MKHRQTLLLAAVALLATAGPALAHHPMGGETPGTLATGLLSGLGHPIIGVDHLAFVVAVGLAAAFTGNRLLSPLAFVAATIAGCLITVTGAALPAVELAVAASLMALGAIVLSGRAVRAPVLIGFFALAGLFHGAAYAEAILGAEATPLVAYLAGFAMIQYAIAAGAAHVALRVWRAAGPDAIRPRLAGAVVAGVGAALLVENLEGLLFA